MLDEDRLVAQVTKPEALPSGSAKGGPLSCREGWRGLSRVTQTGKSLLYEERGPLNAPPGQGHWLRALLTLGFVPGGRWVGDFEGRAQQTQRHHSPHSRALGAELVAWRESRDDLC